ncbi:hypothetical protein D3C72_1804480 [compost metagenome]
MDVNSSIPNIPKLETVNVDPSQSAGCNFLAFAFWAKSFTSAEICDNDLPSAKRTTGTNKPSSTAIATPMLVCSLKRILSPCHEEFTAGCFFKATATAFTTISLKETFTGAISLICARAAIALSMSIDTVK